MEFQVGRSYKSAVKIYIAPIAESDRLDRLSETHLTFGTSPPLATKKICLLSVPHLLTEWKQYNRGMSTARYVRWQDGEMWLGYFEEFPDYLTQGESLSELEENLRDIYRDLTSGQIPGVRSIAELAVE